MSGPALRQADSHSSIHESAIGEAEHLSNMLRACLGMKDQDRAYETACVALEHWEARTLAHASEEEEGLYKEIEATEAEELERLVALTRDHELMRRIAKEIRDLLAGGKADWDVLVRLEALILIDRIHNEEEMRMVAGLEDRRWAKAL